MPKYPDITVRLVGEDGNAFSIIGRATAAMRRAGLSQNEILMFLDDATSGDYGYLLMTVMNYFTIEEDEDDDESDSIRYWSSDEDEDEDEYV